VVNSADISRYKSHELHVDVVLSVLWLETVSGSAYFIVADKTILKAARKNSFREQMENHAEYCPFWR
jgi:hypothetical protein